jgi:hypothetical protein
MKSYAGDNLPFFVGPSKEELEKDFGLDLGTPY